MKFPSREIESIFSDAALSHSPFLVKPFRQFSSFAFHVVSICIERSRQAIWIALEQQGECQLAQQTSCTKPQDGTISRTQSDIMLSRHLFNQPAILIIGLLRIESKRGHSCASFLFDQSLNENPLTLKYIMILKGYNLDGRCLPPMLGKRPYFSPSPLQRSS